MNSPAAAAQRVFFIGLSVFTWFMVEMLFVCLFFSNAHDGAPVVSLFLSSWLAAALRADSGFTAMAPLCGVFFS